MRRPPTRCCGSFVGRLTVAALAALIVFAGVAPDSRGPIARIAEDPWEFDGRRMTVRGTVAEAPDALPRFTSRTRSANVSSLARAPPMPTSTGLVLEPGECLPREDSAAEETFGGAALVFALPFEAIEERPIVLELGHPAGEDEVRLQLDV